MGSIQEWVDSARSLATTMAKELVFGTDDDLGPPAPTVADQRRVDNVGLHQLLPYDQYDPATELYYNTSSIGFVLVVAPQTGANDELARTLLGLYDTMPADHGVQWMMLADPIIEEHLDRYVDLRRTYANSGEAPPFYLEQAERRAAALRANQGRPLFHGQNYSITDKRLMLSVVRKGSADDAKVREEMQNLREVVGATLRSASLASRTATPDDLIRFLWPILNPEYLFGNGAEVVDQQYDADRPIRDQLVPFGHHARVKAEHLLFGLPPEEKGDPDKRIAARSFGVLQYPSKKELWEMGNIVGSLFNDVHQYPCPYLITLGVMTLDQNAVETRVALRGARAAQNAKSKMAPLQPELALQERDWRAVGLQLESGGSICELYHTLTLFAPREQIGRCVAAARGIWRSERFKLFPMVTQQLTTFLSAMPMALTPDLRDDLNKMRLISTKTTVNATDMAPVVAEWAGTSGAPNLMFYGRRGTPTPIDLYSSSTNYNGFVDGTSGAGKSVLMNEIIAAFRAVGGVVRLTDVGYSYEKQIAMAGGQYIDFKPGSNIIVNSFSTGGSDADNGIDSEVKFIRPIIARMASPTSPITDLERGLLDKAVRMVWKDYGPDGNPTRVRDALLQLKDQNQQNERVAYELAIRLEPFCDGGVYGRYVNGRTNVNLNNDVVGLELEHLNSDPQLRTVIMLGFTNQVTNEMYRFERSRKKLFLQDEGWQTAGDDQESADFTEEGYRRARKYEGSFFFATQGITDAGMNKATQAAFDNSGWKFHLKQSNDTLAQIERGDIIDLSPGLKKMLKSLSPVPGRYSEFVLVDPDGGQHILRHIPDEFTLAMATTKGPDYNFMQRLIDGGMSTEDAIRALIEHKRKPR
ncbi:type IV secretion system protein TraC [Burkholderia glumae]|uniref:Type IV secretion system protein TraC n=2 Tax=Burkholderia glumae TaxID=337 RepID=A0ABY5BBZ4_BURGL|nr:type IV secretion system protein TraC [Burkholderia glumae]QJW82491.1 type IV secretion system protein TraC [Burkholderia glumae]USS44363.1 type IV secretion system protein TraC [Burkholderia glumae]